MKTNNFNLFEPRSVEEAIVDMRKQINLYHIYKEGIIDLYPRSVDFCKKRYSELRDLAIKLGGLEKVEIFPEKL